MRAGRLTDPAAIASELIRLLHDGAGADEFMACLADAEALPPDATGRASLLDDIRRAMAVRNRLELHQERERGLLAVIESAEDLSSHLELDGLLSAVVVRARELLGADVAWLSIFDAQRNEFRVVDAEGALRESTSRMMADEDRGVASVVLRTRLPFTTADYLHDSRFTHDPALDQTFREEGLMALAGVPLLWNGEVTGLLFVADRYPRSHSAQSISILCTLATHAAVALRNARDFERASEALAAASRTHAEFERYARGIQAAADAHEQMTSLLARGASLATLCEAVAQLLGGAVLVLDEAMQVLSRACAPSYRGCGAGRYAPFGPRSSEIAQAFQASRALGRSALAFEEAGESCRVMAVIGGEGALGALLLFHGGGLEDVMVRTFERSSSVIGIVLLSQERMEAVRNRESATLLRALLSPRAEDAAEVADRAARQGLDLQQPLALLLVQMDSTSAPYAARGLRALPALAHALIDPIDAVLVILCSAAAGPQVRELVQRWAGEQARAGFRGVLSRPLRSPAEVAAAYAALSRALPVLERMGVQRALVPQNELALYATLFEAHDRASLSAFLEGTIGPVVAHDRRRGTALASTLLAWFESNQNARLTAEALDIHVNTVRQRLAATQELLGPWDSAARALELHMALRLWSLGTPVQP